MGKSVVLYSGGLDSTVVLAEALRKGEEVLALSIDYNQSNQAELSQCRRLAGYWGFPHKIIKVDLERTDAREEIPARNTIFLAKALEWAILNKADKVLYGAEPDATYTDSSLEYISAMNNVMSLHGVKLEAPIRGLKDKLAVLEMALELGVPLDMVHSSRTNKVDGGCKASGRFLRTVLTMFPALSPYIFLDMLREAHGYSDRNPFFAVAPQTGSFKFLPALLTLASVRTMEKKVIVYTTGNWGRAVHYVNHLLEKIESLTIVETHDLDKLKQNNLNTNLRQAVWGTKQALSRLPRPRYMSSPIACKVTQGHLKAALEGLGYTVDANGLPLQTEHPFPQIPRPKPGLA